MIENDRLETARLFVRPFERADIDRLIEIFADPAVAQYVGEGDPLSREEGERWVRNSRENLKNYGFGTGAVVERTAGD